MSNKKENTHKKEWKKPQVKELSTSASKSGLYSTIFSKESAMYHTAS
ncbi:hypothetical protein ACFLR1_05510 [Bacteroidota bacterium]